MLKKLFAIFLVSVFCQVAIAANEAPLVMLEKTSNQMLAALKKNQERIKQDPAYVYGLARRILLPHVDVAVMSRLALGREGWKTASTVQKKQFQREFTELLIRTYGSALAAYSNETIKFRPIRGGTDSRKRIQIDSVIYQHGGPAIPVSYRLLRRGDDWKVYDMMVDGVSMIQSFRSQFASVIQQGGMDGLLKAMQQHAKETK